MTDTERGHEAARILGSEVFRDAIAAADAHYVQKWRDAGTPEQREWAHAMQAALADVVMELEVIIGRGEMERARR